VKPIHLTDRQRELYEKGRDYIAAHVPGWDDGHPADPALAVLELGTALSEVQERTFAEIDGRGYAAFLKLLGRAPRPLRPARLLALPGPGGRPYPGQRFWLEGIPFETEDPGREAGGRLRVSCRQDGAWREWDGGMPLALATGGALRLTFSEALPPGEKLRLWCGILPEPGRVPPDASLPYPVRLAGYLPDGSGFPVRDGTRGLLRGGFLSFALERAAAEVRIEIEGEVEGAPRLSALTLEPVRLVQRHTRSAVTDLTAPFRLPGGWLGKVLRFFVPRDGGGWLEMEGLSAGADGRVSGWGAGAAPALLRVVAAEPDFRAVHPLEGTAEERAGLAEEGVLPEYLRLMVEEDGVWYDCPVRAPDPEATLPRGCRWDGGAGELCFGDGRDFCVPRPGRLLVVRCARSLGAAGNGACGELRPDGAAADGGVRALFPSWGGRDTETPREAFLRAAESWRGRRAVSLSDYEDIARQTPGLALEKVRAVAVKGKAGVELLVMPRSEERYPQLTGWQRQRLLAWMERHRMLGIPVEVRGPEYVPVEVRAVLRAARRVDEAALHKAALALTDGVAGPLDFGPHLSYAALFTALGGVPNVLAVESLDLRVQAAGVRSDQRGGVRLAPEMLPYLDRFDFTIP